MASFSRSLDEALHRAIALATERDHELATLEHLLLALTDDRDAVITSYSIHYTKLYEASTRERLPPIRSPGTRSNRTGISFQGDAQADLFCFPLPDGEQGGRGSHADMAMDTRMAVRPEEMCVHVGATVVRITSYNVCYTKLLRVKAGELS